MSHDAKARTVSTDVQSCAREHVLVVYLVSHCIYWPTTCAQDPKITPAYQTDTGYTYVLSLLQLNSQYFVFVGTKKAFQ